MKPSNTISVSTLIEEIKSELRVQTGRWRMFFISLVMALAGQVGAHSGGLNKQGCHAGSQPYHCHKPKSIVSKNFLKTRISKRCLGLSPMWGMETRLK